MTIDWTHLYKKYAGYWVALAQDEKTVVAYSKDAKEAYIKATKKGLEVPIMFNVPEEQQSYVGRFSN